MEGPGIVEALVRCPTPKRMLRAKVVNMLAWSIKRRPIHWDIFEWGLANCGGQHRELLPEVSVS